MSSESFFLLDLEENNLIRAFTHTDSGNADSFYFSELIGKISDEQLISRFTTEVLDEYFYTDIEYISGNKAAMLLRQMAMFKKDYKGKRTQICNSSDAKIDTSALLDFLGPKAAFYTNAQSMEHPHDNPGIVLSSDSESSYKTICIFVVTEDRFLFISQYW